MKLPTVDTRQHYPWGFPQHVKRYFAPQPGHSQDWFRKGSKKYHTKVPFLAATPFDGGGL
jgi:hypothetical protein